MKGLNGYILILNINNIKIKKIKYNLKIQDVNYSIYLILLEIKYGVLVDL